MKELTKEFSRSQPKETKQDRDNPIAKTKIVEMKMSLYWNRKRGNNRMQSLRKKVHKV